MASQNQGNQPSGTQSSGGNQPSSGGNQSASQQQWEARLNVMDSAFNDQATIITQCRTQLATFKAAVTNGQPVTYNQLESVDQSLARAMTATYSARSALPIGVTA